MKCRNVNEACINFFNNNIIDPLYDVYFPVAKIRLKQKKHFAPWITKDLPNLPKRAETMRKISK